MNSKEVSEVFLKNIMQFDSLDLPLGFKNWINANDKAADNDTLAFFEEPDVKKAIYSKR